MRLNDDDKNLMPITWAVYHAEKERKRKPDEKPTRGSRPRQLWEALDQPVLDQLSDRFPKARRYAAQRRQRAR